jgi:hypothetical protein
MTRPRDRRELDRVVGELRKARRIYPGSVGSEADILWAAALIHHFGARVLLLNEWNYVRREDSPAPAGAGATR